MKLRSDNVTKGSERAPNRSLFYAMGYTKEELERPLIGVVSGLVPRFFTQKTSRIAVFASVLSAHLIGSLLVKTFGIYTYYKMSYVMLLLYRLPTYGVITVLESFFLCLIFKHKAFRKYTR